MSKSSLTRVATDIIKLHISHEHYMSKNEAFYMGRKQGDVNYSRLFGEDIYKQSQFGSHLELTIPLPTKLLLRDNIDWEKIADDFINEFGFVEKYGEDQVAAFIHYRDAESGRTKNENLHIHIAYVDRTVSKENLLYQSNKRPHAINLSSGNSCPKSKFKENALNHFKVEENTPVLNFELVDEELMDEFKSYFGRGGKKIKDEDIPHVKTLREEIVEQAQSESIGLLVYSSRQENQLEQLAFKEQGQQQRDIATRVLNNIINEYRLEDHIEEFGYYSSLTKKEKQDKRDEALDQREQELGYKLANIPNEVKKQVDEQVVVQEEELFDKQLKFYQELVLRQNEEIRQVNKLIEEPLKVTDKVLEFIDVGHFENVFDYYSAGDDLLDFNVSIFASIENAEMLYEDTYNSNTKYFDSGFKAVQSIITSGIQKFMDLASIKNEELDTRETNIDNTINKQVNHKLAIEKKKLEEQKAKELELEKQEINQRYKLQLYIDSLVNHIDYLNKFVNIIDKHGDYPLTFEYAYDLHDIFEENEEVEEILDHAANILANKNEEKTFERIEKIKNIVLKIGKFISSEFSERFGVEINNEYDEPTR